MNRAEQAEKTTKALYGGASALGVTDPEFAAIKERLIYGEVYEGEKLSARLRELVLADQDGRLVVLPCKVGDDVWFVRKFGKERCIKRAEVSCINIDCRGKVFVSARRISGGYIGKTVFLTREEAEAALAQEGGNDHA